jgi:hypothetical protein
MSVRHVAVTRAAVALLLPVTGLVAAQPFVHPAAAASAHASTTHASTTHAKALIVVQSDLRNLATAEENYLTDNARYATTRQAATEGWSRSPHSTVRVSWYDGTSSYCLSGRFRGESHTERAYDSARGGLQQPGFSCAAVRPASAGNG